MHEPILLLGKQRFANVDIRIRVKGGGQVSQIYGKAEKTREWGYKTVYLDATMDSLKAGVAKAASSFAGGARLHPTPFQTHASLAELPIATLRR